MSQAEMDKMAAKLKGLYFGGQIDLWFVFTNYRDKTIVAGMISGDSRFVDGDVVFTTEVEDIDTDEVFATSKNTFYKLGIKAKHPHNLKYILEKVQWVQEGFQVGILRI